jgi:DNA polymerase-3 subunit alpha
MAVLDLEDLEGQVRVVVLPDVYKKCSRLLIEDTPVLIKGVLDLVRELPKIKALEIFDLERMQENATKSIRLKIDGNHITEKSLDDIAQILSGAEQGHSRVYIDMLLPDDPEINRVEIEVGTKTRIRPSAIIHENLAAILGEENVMFCH